MLVSVCSGAESTEERASESEDGGVPETCRDPPPDSPLHQDHTLHGELLCVHVSGVCDHDFPYIMMHGVSIHYDAVSPYIAVSSYIMMHSVSIHYSVVIHYDAVSPYIAVSSYIMMHSVSIHYSVVIHYDAQYLTLHRIIHALYFISCMYTCVYI